MIGRERVCSSWYGRRRKVDKCSQTQAEHTYRQTDGRTLHAHSVPFEKQTEFHQEKAHIQCASPWIKKGMENIDS